MDEQRNLHVYNFDTREHMYDLMLNARPTSLSISRDSRHMLVNKTDNEALLIDIETRETVQKYTGHTGGQFTIRSGFGGANENFVISGSEGEHQHQCGLHQKDIADIDWQDGHVFVWHKLTATLVHEAEAHHPRCNAVSWSPVDPCMFATCGDDNRIRL
jgi:WD40 repeat protein